MLVLCFLLALAQAGLPVTVMVTLEDAPVAGATVSAGDVSAVSDADGRARLTLPAGPAAIVVALDGFDPLTLKVEVAPPGVTLEAAFDAETLEVEEEVVVTATRSGRRLQDEPLRVEVIDREEIEEKALMTPGSVAMLLGETTGLRVQTTAPSLGAANVRIQGLRGHYSQLLADGLPLYGPQGDSFSLLQVPPLDLGQVEIIKGAASALYGPAALGGVINLVSRRPTQTGREALVNATSLGGVDGTFWLAQAPAARGWGGTLLSGYHGQARRDRDGDGWTDVAGYQRAVARPRVVRQGEGGSLFATAGVNVEWREGGTMPGGQAPDGSPFAEQLDTTRADGGVDYRRVTAAGLAIAARASFARTGQDRTFGEVRERGTRQVWFGEASLAGAAGRHTWVAGAAVQQDRYRPRDVPRFAYTFTTPALFAQDQVALGPRAAVSLSARADVHSEYGVLVSPRVSLLARPAEGWTVRLSGGTGAFAPTPFNEETDETGLSRLAPLAGLEAERARGASLDLTWARGPVEVSGTVFGSRVHRAVQLVDAGPAQVRFVNAAEPTRTWGTELIARYRRGTFLGMLTHAYTRATEADLEGAPGDRRAVSLTPRQAGSFNLMWEGEPGRLGIEVYATGRQPLDRNPYRTTSAAYVLFGALVERRIGAVRAFLNLENLGGVRQTRFDPLTRPSRLPDGRWTVEAWAPLEGRVANGGVRLAW